MKQIIVIGLLLCLSIPSVRAQIPKAQHSQDGYSKPLQTDASPADPVVEKPPQNQLVLLKNDPYPAGKYQLFNVSLVAVGLITGLLALIYRNNRHKKQADTILQQQTLEIQRQRDQAQQALAELKIIQAQLIQKEKMASLGELTAGIAHEIQNPLNFVNNFSEVSTDLLHELSEGPLLHLPESERVYVAELLDDLTKNLKKINHHGHRASNIVKGILDQSRTSAGDVQPTDLNVLADESLRLAYHGQRAKDKEFSCSLVTHFDTRIGKVAIISQEIGRVILNLFTNAFYAVRERQKQENSDYQPTVTLTTQRTDSGVEIRVSDNGIGIPLNVQQKIFQPFFTTKPTGEGTGLGLSLSHDIIKGHKGSLSVKSQPGEGTEFTVTLPLSA